MKKIKNLENENFLLKEELNEKNNEIKVLNDTINNMREEHSKTVAIMQKEITELRKENKHLKKVIKDKDAEIKQLNKKIDNLEKENIKLKIDFLKIALILENLHLQMVFIKLFMVLEKKLPTLLGVKKIILGLH